LAKASARRACLNGVCNFYWRPTFAGESIHHTTTQDGSTIVELNCPVKACTHRQYFFIHTREDITSRDTSRIHEASVKRLAESGGSGDGGQAGGEKRQRRLRSRGGGACIRQLDVPAAFCRRRQCLAAAGVRRTTAALLRSRLASSSHKLTLLAADSAVLSTPISVLGVSAAVALTGKVSLRCL
jgi:hypothetical protein